MGEILLVVIGILIALQVNNWNEQNNARLSEARFIENIKADLEKDYDELNRVVELGNLKIQTTEQIMSGLPELYYRDKARLDSLVRDVFIAFEGFFPISGTFDAAVSGNEISRYRNEAFKSQIFNLYNTSYDRINKNLDIMIERWGIFRKRISMNGI